MRPPCSSRRSIRARASVDLPLPERPVKNRTRPCSSGSGWSSSTIAAIGAGRDVVGGVGQAVDRVAGGVVVDDLRRRGRGRRPRRRGTAAGPRPRSPSSSRSAAASVARTSATGESAAVPVPLRASSTTRPRPRSSASSASVSASVTGTKVRAGVLLAHLGGGEVQPAEGAVLRVGERLHASRRAPTRASGRPSGSTSSASVGAVGQRERHRAAGFVEAGQRCVGAGDEELQVVELGRRGAVLDHPRILSLCG